MADIEVHMGDIAVGKDANNLIASGIGSCLVITLYDPQQKIGALAHAMLPPHSRAAPVRRSLSEGGSRGKRDTKYIDIAIEEMLKKLLAQGARREKLEAKIVGGANMFSAFTSDIGKESVLSTKEKLKEEGINLVGESVGGSQGRSVEFSSASGLVTVRIKF